MKEHYTTADKSIHYKGDQLKVTLSSEWLEKSW
jgi:hypothetical protein